MNWMMEVGRDRFAGYPDASDDSQTPFLDILSQTNVYPLQNNLLPFDWDHCRTPNEIGNVDNETQVKHVKGQYSLYSTRLSTASASYIMQGACDPGVSGSTLPVYYPNCTDANNNVTSSESTSYQSADLS
jgi:hypothetical protein